LDTIRFITKEASMKKLLSVLLALMLLASPVFAANVLNTEIMDLTFDDDPTSGVSDTLLIAGYDKVAFYVLYDETEVGNSISAAVTLDVSYDGINWLTGMSFYDIAGGATLQTSQTISADGWYVFWLNKDICGPYVRVAVTATNTDADDTLDVNIYAVAKE
jgi:opacity protein-like surface antigen